MAGYVGYLTQALVINFPPLLFLTFVKEYGISLTTVSLLIALSFAAQLLTDAFTAKFIAKINIRAAVVAAHILAILGITGYAYLPRILPSALLGLLICTLLSAVGAGFVEVLISPIIEACPSDSKSAAMSLLHSFYCWGYVGVVILSTLFFKFVGIEHWKILTCLWAIIPAIGAVAFAVVPIYNLEGDSKKADRTRENLPRRTLCAFAMFFMLMMCAGAAEMTISQWASTFAEKGLGVSKAFGDLLGPCSFALLMGITRVVYVKFSHKLVLKKFFMVSGILCVISYLLVALSPSPALALVGCALCGVSVGIMWPGTYSLAAVNIPNVSIRMFALLAIGGDLGSMIGPTFAGWLAGFFGDDLSIPFLISCVYPLTITIILIIFSKSWRSEKK